MIGSSYDTILKVINIGNELWHEEAKVYGGMMVNMCSFRWLLSNVYFEIWFDHKGIGNHKIG